MLDSDSDFDAHFDAAEMRFAFELARGFIERLPGRAAQRTLGWLLPVALQRAAAEKDAHSDI